MSMTYRFALLTILMSLNSCASTKNYASTDGAWDLSSDISYVASNSDGTIAYSVLSSAANVLARSESYRAMAQKVSFAIRNCSTWLVLQEVASNGNQVESKWLCNKNGLKSRGMFGIKRGEIYFREVPGESPENVFTDIATELRKATPLDYRRYTTLGAPTVFVTFYDQELVRRALYSPTDLNSSVDGLTSDDESVESSIDVAYQKILSEFPEEPGRR